jgi:hypothetical protein
MKRRRARRCSIWKVSKNSSDQVSLGTVVSCWGWVHVNMRWSLVIWVCS